MKKIFQSLNLIFLVILVIFLPFSAWLVSLTGDSNWSLIRDGLVGLIAVLSLFVWGKDQPKVHKVAALLFFLLAIISIFWREASLAQWAKGIRFIVPPIFLFYILSRIQFEDKHKRVIFNSIIIVGLVVVLLAALELFGVKIPLTTSYSGIGALDVTHYVGTTKIMRLQAVLAGPNALGLYMIMLAGIALCWGRQFLPKLCYPLALLFSGVAILTFSRSAMIGLAIIWIMFKWRYLIEKTNKLWVWIGIGVIVLYWVLKITILANVPIFEQFITHDTSNTYRVEQYQRIWDTKWEIGLLGRGFGTAGPSSQMRLDGGENHWTENIYLDIFEETGLIGVALYVLLISLILKHLLSLPSSPLRRCAIITLVAYSVTGLFINYYTGQVGIYLFWIILALALQDHPKKEISNS